MSKRFFFNVLSDGSVILTIGEGCIQTSARNAHRALSQSLFDGHLKDEVSENALDTLAQFLNTTDFAGIRSEHPDLGGGARCPVRLYR